MKTSIKKETKEQRKIREAQEFINAAKQKEQDARLAEWKAQQNDPEYQRQWAQRRAKSEERARKIAIGKENKRLAIAEKIRKFLGTRLPDEYIVAVHEAGHAVLQEVIGGGCHLVTIIPQEREVENENGKKATHIVLGFSQGSAPDSVLDAVLDVAGGMATQFFGLDGDISSGDYENLKRNMTALHVEKTNAWKFEQDVRNKAKLLFSQPYIKSALLEIADALVIDKTLQGSDVQTIVKKHMFADTPLQDMFTFDAGRQYKFHFRKNRFRSWGGEQAPFAITIGDSDYVQGYPLAGAKYVEQAEKENAQPTLFLVPDPIQLMLPFDVRSKYRNMFLNNLKYKMNAESVQINKQLLAAEPGTMVLLSDGWTVKLDKRERGVMEWAWQGDYDRVLFIVKQEGTTFYNEDIGERHRSLNDLLCAVIEQQFDSEYEDGDDDLESEAEDDYIEHQLELEAKYEDEFEDKAEKEAQTLCFRKIIEDFLSSFAAIPTPVPTERAA